MWTVLKWAVLSLSLLQITETYAFLPREAVTRFLLGCTECQRRPRTPSPTNLSNQSQSTQSAATLGSTSTSLSPNPGSAVLATSSSSSSTTASSSSIQNGSKPRNGGQHAPSEGKNLHNYRHQKQHKTGSGSAAADSKLDKDKDEKYNPLSITNLLKKEPMNSGYLASSDTLPESRRTPESDRASSKSSASSKRKRMLPEGRTPSPQPSQPLPRPWSPGLDPKNTPIDYSLPITTSYLKHQQRLLQEKNKAAAANALRESETTESKAVSTVATTSHIEETESAERERFSPATGLIDTNLNLLATIQHLHCQVMLALTERLRPSFTVPSPLILPSTSHNVLTGTMMMGTEVSVQTGENHSWINRHEKKRVDCDIRSDFSRRCVKDSQDKIIKKRKISISTSRINSRR